MNNERTTVKTIIRQWLEQHNYDGLANPYTKCNCGIDDLMFCYKIAVDCQCALLHDCQSCEENFDCDYRKFNIICPTIPEGKIIDTVYQEIAWYFINYRLAGDNKKEKYKEKIAKILEKYFNKSISFDYEKSNTEKLVFNYTAQEIEDDSFSIKEISLTVIVKPSLLNRITVEAIGKFGKKYLSIKKDVESRFYNALMQTPDPPYLYLKQPILKNDKQQEVIWK